MIKLAAVLSKGVFYTGASHGDVVSTMPSRAEFCDGVKGFMTDDGRFLGREEALSHAVECAQVSKRVKTTKLFSWMLDLTKGVQ